MTDDNTAAPPPGARERLREYGASALKDTELLSLLLCTGMRGMTVTAMAEQLLDQQGGLRGLLRSGAGVLATYPGVGPCKAARVLAAIELGRRLHAQGTPQEARLSSSQEVYRAFAPLLSEEPQECFWAVALNTRHRLVARALIGRGGIDACPVSPADAFRPLLREAAAAAIFVHNHPSGVPEPSREDVLLTVRLCEVGNLLAIPVLDHVIIGRGTYFSFLDAGLLKPPGKASRS